MTEKAPNTNGERQRSEAAALVDLWVNAIEKGFGQVTPEQQQKLLQCLDPKRFYNGLGSTSASGLKVTLVDEIVDRIQKVLSIPDKDIIDRIHTSVAEVLRVGIPFEHDQILEAYQLEALRMRIEHLENRLKAQLEQSDQSRASEQPVL
ncbi:hypothetical protein ACVWWG_007978 [Bradyrhizobium sp. LB7.2]